MRNIKYILLCVLALSFNSYATVDYYYDSLILGNFGSKHLSEENEKLVRQTLRKIGYQNADYVIIRKLSKQMIFTGFTDHNACAIDFYRGPKYIFIAEEWFNTLPENQKIFLIGHEGIHLKHDHQHIKELLSVAWLSGLIALLCKYGNNDDKLRTYSIITAWSLVGEAILGAYSRHCEYDADKCSALALDNIDGGIDWCKDMIAYQEDWESELSQWTISKWSRAFWKTILFPLSTHPKTKNRLKALEALK